MSSIFENLNSINVNEHVEKKNGLSYISWVWAWAEFKKKYPDATYTVWKDEKGLPYAYDPNTGYMCYVTVTAEGLTHEMWLPVMDGANKAMKAEPYTVTNRYGKQTTVEAATMFDINKTIMRALTKCLAMFGLGLYIYAGEDLPEGEEAPVAEAKPAPAPDPIIRRSPEHLEHPVSTGKITPSQRDRIIALTTPTELDLLQQTFGKFDKWTAKSAANVIRKLEEKKNISEIA